VAIRPLSEHPGHADAVRQVLKDTARALPELLPESRLDLTRGLPIHPLEDEEGEIVRPGGSSAPAGWRYLVIGASSGEALATVDVEAEAAATAAVREIGSRLRAQGLLAALRLASTTAEGADFEIRLVTAPTVAMQGVWLQGPDDLFIETVEEGEPDIEPADAFFARVGRAIRKRLDAANQTSWEGEP
jgi:hypothetical protein